MDDHLWWPLGQSNDRWMACGYGLLPVHHMAVNFHPLLPVNVEEMKGTILPSGLLAPHVEYVCSPAGGHSYASTGGKKWIRRSLLGGWAVSNSLLWVRLLWSTSSLRWTAGLRLLTMTPCGDFSAITRPTNMMGLCMLTKYWTWAPSIPLLANF